MPGRAPLPLDEIRAVDLRGRVCGARVPLAPRLETLGKRKILLFDNGKVGDGSRFSAIFEILKSHIAGSFPTAAVSTMSRDLLKRDLRGVHSVVEEAVRTGADAVICALLDQGVTQPSMVLVAELERRGIPTSLVCQGAGGRLAAATAEHSAPGVPLTVLDMARDAAREVVASSTKAVASDIVAGLLRSGPARSLSGIHHSANPASPHRAQEIGISGADASVAYTDLMTDAGLGDGLPFFAPTPARVDAMLMESGIAPDSALWPVVAPRGIPLTAYEVAALAAAAGCEPRWFRFVAAAYRAMAAPEFRLAQAAITTHPGGTLVLASGPDTERLGIASGQGSLGPGYRANATIGRAVALAYSFFLGARVGGSDLSVLGSPAKYSYCCAENLAASPWQGLCADFFDADTTCVTVLKCEGPRTVVDDTSVTARGILSRVAGTITGMGGNIAAMPRDQIVVFLNPGHAAVIANNGWTKTDVQRYLFETARNGPDTLTGFGGLVDHPAWFEGLQRYPVVQKAEDFLVVVAGEPGPHSAVAIPWGSSHAVSMQVSERR